MRDGPGTKERIGQAALRLFVEKGITETTVRDITAAVGITEGAMYRHYPSKEQLAWDLFSTNYTAFADELERVRAEHPTLKAQLQAMIRTFCAFFEKDPVLFSFLLLAQHSEARKVTPEMPSPVQVVRRSIVEAMARGEIPEADPDVATACVLGIVLQVAVFKVYERIEQSLTSLSEALFAACWRALQS